MKRLLLSFIIFYSFSSAAQEFKPFVLTGDLGRLKNGAGVDTVFYSYSANGKHYSGIAAVRNYQFVIKGKIYEPGILSVRYARIIDTEMARKNKELTPGAKIFDAHSKLDIFIQPGEMKFIFGEEPWDYRVEGAPDAGLYKSLNSHIDSINKDTNTADVKAVLRDFLIDHTNSPVSVYALNMLRDRGFEPDSVEFYFNRLTPALRELYAGRKLKIYITLGNGKTAPGFTQADTAGNMISLSSFRGKYVLLDFWGSWCSWCRLENPYLIETFKKYKDSGFTIISIAADEKKAAWLKAIHEDGIGLWTHLSDLKGNNNSVSRLYGVTYYPFNVLIDPQGKIIGTNFRDNPKVDGARLSGKLKEIFGEDTR